MEVLTPSTADDILDANAEAAERAATLSLPVWLREYDDDDYREHLRGTLTLHGAVVALYEQFKSEYGAPLCGATRATFVDEDNGVVYKVPKPIVDGEDDWFDVEHGGDDILCEYQYRLGASYTEARDCEAGDHEDFPLAACRVADNEYGLPVLVMEFVDTEVGDYDDLPEWINLVDSGQAGWTKAGHLVVYDWGNA